MDVILALVGLGVLIWALKVPTAKAWTGTVYIRADGSIDPPTAPIQRNGDVYTLTDNITSDADGVFIQTKQSANLIEPRKDIPLYKK